jgi:hypothetical protein
MNAITNRFISALRLCNGPRAIKARLIAAWLEQMDDIDPDQLPVDIRQNFIELRKAMYSRQPLPLESAPEASIRKMSIREVNAHMDVILAMTSTILARPPNVTEAKAGRTDPNHDGVAAQEDSSEQRLN